MRRSFSALALALASASSGCTALDNFLASIPLFGMMRNSPFFDPYEAPRPAPEGSVPYLSPAGQLRAPLQPSEAALTAFGAATPNPLPASPEVLARGDAMYQRHCMVCHGARGLGDGPILNKAGETGKFPFASNLTLPITQQRTDGYIYGVIRVGRGLMPAYGSRIPDGDRWAIVHYVRQLQRQQAATPGVQGAPTAGPTATGGGAAQGPTQGRR